jgi:peptidoglycan hydrolase-like protein with peptidoglycan-binding domain
LPEIEVTPPSKKPKWTGKRNLGLGSVGDDVRRLQEILQVEGCFDFPNPTGYLGGITRAGIIKLQNKYAKEILHPLGLKSGTGFLGLSSRAFLEKNYS